MKKGWEFIKHVRGEMTYVCEEVKEEVCVTMCANVCVCVRGVWEYRTFLHLCRQMVEGEEGGSEAFSCGAL